MIISNTAKIATITGVAGLLIGTLLGVGIGWKLYHPEQAVESYQPAIVLQNGSVALERKPDQPAPIALKQAAKELSGKLTRTATVKLQPRPKPNAPADCECEPIVLDIGTVDTGNGIRTVVNTDNAEITSGNDNPLVPYTKSRITKWDVGVVVPLDYPKGVGPSVARHIGSFKVGMAAARNREEGWTGFVTASISF